MMARVFPSLQWLVTILALIAKVQCDHFPDWGALGGRPHEPTCVSIPESMTLCSDIGYDQMRLPNLLGHDTLAEAQQQSGSWLPLLNVKCHPFTKLFLCSLFTPVCLESPIYPCRSLCEKVRQGCSQRMETYGYEWPEMLRCDKFPDDNDMCIKPTLNNITDTFETSATDCEACTPVETYENILDNFCRADFVVRAKVKKQKPKNIKLKRLKFFKAGKNKKELRRSKMSLPNDCCPLETGKAKYLIMGTKNPQGDIKTTFTMKWSKAKILKDAVSVFHTLNCTDPNLFSPTADDGNIVPVAPQIKKKKNRKGKRKNRKRADKKRNKKRAKKRRNKKKSKKRKNIRKNKGARKDRKKGSIP